MAIEIYLQQIIGYFRNNFIEDNTATEEELTNLIREKLVLIEDRQERKNLITRILEEIQDLILIYKYREIYKVSKHNQIALPKVDHHIMQHLTYNFRRMI